MEEEEKRKTRVTSGMQRNVKRDYEIERRRTKIGRSKRIS